MILSGLEIVLKIGKEIIINPFDRAKVNPNSYNLSLHHELITYTDFPLDMKKENPYSEITIPTQPDLGTSDLEAIGPWKFFVSNRSGSIRGLKSANFITILLKDRTKPIRVANIRTIRAFNRVCCIRILKNEARLG